VNVENSIVAAGSTALEVLERSPGISVDKDGNISLKGKAEVKVMIDGKPTYLSNQDLANLLRNMQSSQLDKVEIMTNPSAKYDASGNAGIINIKMKRNQNMGLNGSVTLGVGYGRFEKINGSVNLNYRQNKWNLYGNYSANARRRFQEMNLTRKFQTGDFFDQNGYDINKNRGQNFKTGADYFASKNTTLGMLLTGSLGTFNQDGNSNSNIYKNLTVLNSINTTHRDITENWRNLAGNFNLKHTLDSMGREITFDLDYARFDNNAGQLYTIANFDRQNIQTGLSTYERGKTDTGIDIYSAKADYVHPIGKTAKVEAGWKSSWVAADNTMNFWTKQGMEGSETVVDGRTNHFKYNENVNAVYLNANKKFGKTTIQAGLRLEHWHAEGNQVKTNQVFKRDSVQFFPSVFIQHEFSKKYQMGINYSRRIDRPNYQNLNPFLFFLDPYTFEQGNPYLKPQITNSLEMSHTLFGAVNITLNYSKTRDLMGQVLKQNDATLQTFVMNDNYGFRENYGIAISTPVPIAKWWMGNLYVNTFHNYYEAKLLGNDFKGGITAVQANLQNKITLSKTLSAELSGFYQSGFLEGMIVGKDMGQISLGLQKQLWKNKATLRVNVRDIFWTQYFRGSVQYQNLDVNIQNKWESRVASMSFTYRFGNSKVAAVRQRQSGLEDEKGRVGQKN
jgi:iron complex outermembrane recepter protein